MLSLLLLGCQRSGKLSLARRIFRECLETGRDENLREYSTNVPDMNVSIVNASFQRLALAQKLARMSVSIVIVTMPRDMHSTLAAQNWVQVARTSCPDAKIALAITKNDLKPRESAQFSASASSSQVPSNTPSDSSCQAPLAEHMFDSIVYEAMQAAQGVDRLFYLSNVTGQGMNGLKAWVHDTRLARATGNDFSSFGEINLIRGKKPRFRKKQRGCTLDGCDSCTTH